MTRQVLSIQGLVQVIDAQGRRRVLRVGERVGKGELFELSDGAELIVRLADGSEEQLHGRPLLVTDASREVHQPELPPIPHVSTMRNVRAVFPYKLFDQASPEAGFLSGEPNDGGHGFVRVERVQFEMPNFPFELLPRMDGIVEQPAVVANSVVELDGSSEISQFAHQVAQQFVSWLFEGGSEEVNGDRSHITQEILTIPDLFVDADGRLVGDQPLVLRQQYSMVTLSLIGQDEQGRYLWQKESRTHNDEMPNIEPDVVVQEEFRVQTQNQMAFVFVNKIQGDLDYMPAELIEVQEIDDGLSAPLLGAELRVTRALLGGGPEANRLLSVAMDSELTMQPEETSLPQPTGLIGVQADGLIWTRCNEAMLGVSVLGALRSSQMELESMTG